MKKVSMPFGKHKDVPLDEVPLAYLRWLKENVKLYGWLAEAVDAVLSGKPAPDDEAGVHRVVPPWTPSEGEIVVM